MTDTSRAAEYAANVDALLACPEAPPIPRLATMRVRPAPYTLRQLDGWRKALEGAGVSRGVHMTFTDSARIVVMLADSAAMAELRRTADSLGIPASALRMRATAPVPVGF